MFDISMRSRSPPQLQLYYIHQETLWYVLFTAGQFQTFCIKLGSPGLNSAIYGYNSENHKPYVKPLQHLWKFLDIQTRFDKNFDKLACMFTVVVVALLLSKLSSFHSQPAKLYTHNVYLYKHELNKYTLHIYAVKYLV